MPLTFYELEADVDRFQYFLLEDAAAADRYRFDGRPLAQVWRPPDVFSYQPRLPEGDFWSFGLGAFGTVFAIRPELFGRNGLPQFLASVGELLPLPYNGRVFAVWNITECIDALDTKQSEWLLYDDGGRFRVATPRFRLDRLGWNVFKVPELPTSIFAWTDDRTERKQLFRNLVDNEQLTGILFRELYSVA